MDIAKAIEENILYLSGTVIDVPCVIDHVLLDFRIHEVLDVMDIHANCMSCAESRFKPYFPFVSGRCTSVCGYA